jgi:hypothetical protein
VAVVTALPPANGVTDKAEEKGKPELAPMKLSVPVQLPETVITTELLLLYGKGRTTQAEELPI